jgi:hypothetical protein
MKDCLKNQSIKKIFMIEELLFSTLLITVVLLVTYFVTR